MPSVGDAIFIQIGLDTTGLNQGEAAASRSIEQALRSLQAQGSQLEHTLKNTNEGVETLAKGIAGFFGLLLNFEGFKNLIIDTAEAGSQMGRFAESIDKTVEETQTLQQAFKAASGDNTGILKTIRQMRLDLAAVPLQYTAWMSDVESFMAPGHPGWTVRGKDEWQILLEVSKELQKRPDIPAARAVGQIFHNLPLTEADIVVLTKNKLLLEQLRKQQEIGTPTTPQSKAMEQLQADIANVKSAAGLLATEMVTLAEPWLHELLQITTRVLKWLRGLAQLVGLGGAPTQVTVHPKPENVTPFTEQPTGPPTKSPESLVRKPSTSVPFVPLKPQSSAPGPTSAPPSPGSPSAAVPPPSIPPGSVTAVGGGAPAAFIVHHTGGGGDVAGVQETLRQRGLGVQYVMDRQGNITQIGGPGSSHMMTGWGAGAGLSNRNTVGMEVIARDDRDVTPAQVAAAKKFIAEKYPNTPVFGHGEVNPGHKEATEGMTIVNAIRRERQLEGNRVSTPSASVSVPATAPGSVRGSMFNDAKTASGKSAASVPGIAIPSGGKMGDMYEITTPDGRKFIAPLIDRGPADWTGRGVDISQPLAEKMGYGRNFPTDAKFTVRPLAPQTPAPPQAGITPSRVELPTVATGAAATAANNEAIRPQMIENNNAAHINQLTVNTHSTDATGIAQDIKDEIGKQLDLVP